MSYRGQRRDSPRSSSGSYGGGGGGGGSRRQSYGSSNQVNPWQGGVVPGGNQMGGLGLLPTPAQSGILSQLSTPEAQLAMATNLLNKILSPQQSQTSSVPSLLSLPGPMNRGGMSYSDYRSRGTFADRRRERPGDRRMQPYSKSGLNRRGDGKSRLGKSRSSDKSSTSPKPKKRDSDKKDKNKDGEKPNGDVSVEDDESKREDGDEKKDDKDGDKDSDTEKDRKMSRGARYAGIPHALLACHVCHKNMWDATSFEKHMTGRRHQMMMEQLDETYKIKVELLRHEQRAAESQRELEIERLQRQGKKVFNNKREYCTMCDLHFYGNLISHRKKDRHQKLKAFLHPKCHLCHKEFPNRLEWDDHKLTASHLKKVADYHRTTKPGLKDEDMEGNDIESLDGGDVSVFAELDDDFDFSKDGKKLDIDLTDIPTSVEEYDPEAPVGTDLVAQVQGHLCKLCNKFMSSNDEASVHSRTLTHYKNFVAVVKMKAKAEKDKEAAEKAAEAKARREENEKKNDEKDDDGNWKRHKDGEKETEVKEEKMEDGEEKQQQNATTENETIPEEKMEVDAATEGDKIDVKKEKYDPEKAEEDETEEKEQDTAVEEPEEETKTAEEGTPTRGRNKATRGGSGRGKARRGK
ncbi:protein on ecdysone puffs [Lycorma delicatula]|uniref:protein on ecdysone puffs n=1 Tax=Lycorma delicatula TaxID=130591 RepID=UPI003F510390